MIEAVTPLTQPGRQKQRIIDAPSQAA